eukprot:2545795-Rhodomonas_salina.1
MTRDDYHRGLTTPSNFGERRWFPTRGVWSCGEERELTRWVPADFSPVGTDSRSFVYHGRQVA